MELRQLRYFLSVADSRSFVSAASSLYISRQAVSKAISQLETELGVELFVRDTSGAFLTPTGLMFYERVRGIVKELDSIADQIRSGSNRYHQSIRMAFSVGTLSLVEDRLIRFRETRENLEVAYSEYTEEECIRMLQEHQADIMISVQPPTSPQFVSEEIFTSRIGVLMHDVEGLRDFEDLDITDMNWIPIACQADKRMQEFCSRFHLSPQYQGQDYHRLFTLCASGKCALLLPECLVPWGISGVCWTPFRQEEYWRLYATHLQIAESNLLYSTVLEELHTHVLLPGII